jgi:hypothetical protein
MFTNEMHNHDVPVTIPATMDGLREGDPMPSNTDDEKLSVAVLAHAFSPTADLADVALAALGIESPANGDEVYWQAAELRSRMDKVREILADRRITHEAIVEHAPVPAASHGALAVAS